MYDFVSKQIEYSIDKIKILKKSVSLSLTKFPKIQDLIKLSLFSLTLLWLLVELNQGLPFDNRAETK